MKVSPVVKLNTHVGDIPLQQFVNTCLTLFLKDVFVTTSTEHLHLYGRR